MKKRFYCLIAVIQLLAVCLFCNVYAEEEYIKNFSRKNLYSQNQFTDVHDEWFAAAVREVYETGLMYGDSETTFNPNGNIDNAAVIAIAARLHSIYNTGSENFSANTSVWYQPYLEYVLNKGICDSGFDPTAISTRSVFVGIMGNATNKNIFTVKNNIDNGDLADVSGWYSNTAYTYYRAGILSGNDEYGTFAPYTSITRAEVAAILSRIIKPSERINVELKFHSEGTYSIMENNGSLEAFKQRAILANLKMLLNGEPQGEDWQNDVWVYEHPEIPGNNIRVGYREIERRYFTDDITSIFVPNKYLGRSGDAYTNVGDWSLYTGFRCYLSDYTGSMPDGLYGDLYLSKPTVAGYTETYTYYGYTDTAQYLITNAPYNQVINEDAVKEYVRDTYNENISFQSSYDDGERSKDSTVVSLYLGQLVEWQGRWYIIMNKNNMYQPFPQENGNQNQTDYSFDAIAMETWQWCRKNYGKYVMALVSDEVELDSPIFLASISGYSSVNEGVPLKSWHFENGKLTIQWKYPQVKFENPILIYDKSWLEKIRDVDLTTKENNTNNVKNENNNIIQEVKEPKLTITTCPATSNKKDVTIKGTVSDANDYSRDIKVTINGNSVYNSDGNWSEKVTLKEGENTLKIVATNSLGKSTTETRTITFDVGVPSLTITTCPETSDKKNVTIKGTVSDVNDYKGDINVTINGNSVYNSSGSWSKEVTLKEGENTFTIVATNSLGKSTTETRTISFGVGAPTLTIATCPETSDNEKITIKGTVSDVNDYKGNVNVTINGEYVYNSNGSWSKEITLEEGINTVTVVATNSLGKSTTEERKIKFSISAPEIQFINCPETTTKKELTVKGKIKGGNKKAMLFINDEECYVNSSGEFSGTLTLKEGTNTFKFRAVNDYGKEVTETRTITYLPEAEE